MAQITPEDAEFMTSLTYIVLIVIVGGMFWGAYWLGYLTGKESKGKKGEQDDTH